MLPVFKRPEDVAGGKRLLSGAKQQPDEHPGRPREGEVTRQHPETSNDEKNGNGIKTALSLFSSCG